MAALSFLDRGRSVAGPGFSRWLVPPAAWAVNLSIGQIYAFSVFKIPLTRQLGITHSGPADWTQPSVSWIFSLAIAILGISAAIFGKWVERIGPRKAMFVAACCFGIGFYISSVGVMTHRLWIVYLGYGGIGGIGLGLGYITPVATLLKWFPDRPGLATGLAMVGFGGGAMIGSPLAVLLMAYFRTESSTGVVRTLPVMGTIYSLAMVSGALLVRIPAPGWRPDGQEPQSLTFSAVKDHGVSVHEAVRTRQFWLLWLVICLNSIAGFGILEQASPMIQDLFGIGAVAAGGFVGVLSLCSMAGRFFWASLSDYFGRKTTFIVFFALGILLYGLLPSSGANYMNSIFLFVLVAGVLISIYGRIQTATSTAGVLGPILVNYSRQHQLAIGATRTGAYQDVLHLMVGLLVLGLIANLLVHPVTSRLWTGSEANELAPATAN